MKDISELNFPEDIKYTDDHEWTKISGDTVKIGLTDYAQDQLGDIVYVELPGVGDTFSKGDEFGSVESVKAVSEIFMPVGGEVIAINEDLEDAPELVSNDPYNGGWLIEVKLEDASELEALLDQGAYLASLKG